MSPLAANQLRTDQHAVTEMTLQSARRALELVGSLTAVRGYSPEAARELKVAEETASEIVELIEQELD